MGRMPKGGIIKQVIEWREIDDKLMSREEYYFRSKQDEWEVYTKVVSGIYRSYDGKWVDITLDNCIMRR